MNHQRALDAEQVRFNQFESRLLGPIYWVQCADDLIASAKALEPSIDLVWERMNDRAKNPALDVVLDNISGSYFMLSAFAIENLLKAALISLRRIEFVKEFRRTRKFPKILKTHNLYDLATALRLPIPHEEEDLFRRLARHSVWAGRYPVPIDYPSFSPTEVYSDGEIRLVNWKSRQDSIRLDALFRRLRLLALIEG